MTINEILKKPCHNASSKYGAQIGRRAQTEGNPDYDTGGAYWGGNSPLYCAFSPDNTKNDTPIMVFVRATNRTDAKQEVLAELPGDGWTFFR